MSRLYFHTPTQEAALSGAEFAWMRHMAFEASDHAWDLDRFDSVQHLLSLVPGSGFDSYLHHFLREAQADASLIPRAMRCVRTALHNGLDLHVDGVSLRSNDVTFNTAIADGSDPVALATKMYGWGCLHAWIDGPDRAWAADLVEIGLDTRVLRHGMGWEARFAAHDVGDGVLALLRARDDEPAVLSYSVDDSFPSPEAAGWLDTPPTAVVDDREKLLDWRETRWEEFGELTDQQQWELAFTGLRERKPWAQLSEATLRTQHFSWPVTAYDLMRPDHADHLQEILAEARAWHAEHSPRQPGLAS